MRLRATFLGSHFLCSTGYYVDRTAVGGLNRLQIVRPSIFIEEDFRLPLRRFGRRPRFQNDGVGASVIRKLKDVKAHPRFVSACSFLRASSHFLRRSSTAHGSYKQSLAQMRASRPASSSCLLRQLGQHSSSRLFSFSYEFGGHCSWSGSRHCGTACVACS